MMCTQTAPAQLFYDFDLERHVPSGHMLREIDRFLDVDGIGCEGLFASSTATRGVPHRSRADHPEGWSSGKVPVMCVVSGMCKNGAPFKLPR